MRTGERSQHDTAWCEVSVSPLIAQSHNLIEKLRGAGVRVVQPTRTASDALCIHVIAWEQLADATTDKMVRLVVIGDRADESQQREAARQGAAALIAVDRLQQDLEPAIRCVMAGFYPMPHGIAPTLVARLDVPPTSIGLDEMAMLKRLLEGATVAEVAADLGCSERHARRRLRTMWEQMGVSGRREGLATAVRWGLQY